ncbi:MAG: hypothetical protein U0Q22_01170 [Acidimicrobiales bacterium]
MPTVSDCSASSRCAGASAPADATSAHPSSPSTNSAAGGAVHVAQLLDQRGERVLGGRDGAGHGRQRRRLGAGSKRLGRSRADADT